jgi:hypothetical protein
MTPASLAVDPFIWWFQLVQQIAAAALLLGYLAWRLWIFGRTRSWHFGEFARKRFVGWFKRQR